MAKVTHNFKDYLNLVAGEIFQAGGSDWFTQQIQVAFCMFTANPWF